jgi:hypothetical protein
MSNRTAEIAAAREVDTMIAAKWDMFWEIDGRRRNEQQKLESTRSSLSRMKEGDRQFAQFTDLVAWYEGEVSTLAQAAAMVRKDAIELDELLYTGWTRFFLVKHIHSSMSCSSFRPTTRVGWLPNVSGLTEAEAVKEHGATLCTICYPSAPVELTTAAVDPNLCAGSGQYHSTEHLTGRENAWTAPAGYCDTCRQWTTLTKSGNLRKHKLDETKRKFS